MSRYNSKLFLHTLKIAGLLLLSSGKKKFSLESQKKNLTRDTPQVCHGNLFTKVAALVTHKTRSLYLNAAVFWQSSSSSYYSITQPNFRSLL